MKVSIRVKNPDAHVHYMLDEHNNAYRVWLSTNAGDQFDLIPIKEFPLAFVEKLPSIFVEGYPEDDSGELVCARCRG